MLQACNKVIDKQRNNKHKHIDIYSNAQILGIEKGTD